MKTKSYNYASIIIIGFVMVLIGVVVSKLTYSPDAEFWTQVGLGISEFTGFLM